MSRFDDLCTAAENNLKLFQQHREGSVMILGRVLSELRRYLEVPDSHFHYVPPGEEFDRESDYTLPGAVKPEPMGYVAVDVILTLTRDLRSLRKNSLRVPVHVRVANDEVRIEIRPVNYVWTGRADGDWEWVAAEIYEKVLLDHYEYEYQRFLSDDEKAMGFRLRKA